MPRKAPVAGQVSAETSAARAPRKSARERGYTWQWEKARAAFLAIHPLCVLCEALGVVTPATVVDHIRPHRGDRNLFWLVSNWQALCKACHDAKRGEEKGRR